MEKEIKSLEQRNSILFFLLFASILLSTLGVFQIKNSSMVEYPSFDSFIWNLKTEYLADYTGEEILFKRNWHNKKNMELVHPETYLPNGQRLAPLLSAFRDLNDCSKKWSHSKTDSQLKKLTLWRKHICDGESLHSAIWDTAPFSHPLGGSWAHWVWKKKKFPLSWLTQHKSFIHLLENQELPKTSLSPEEIQVSQFSPRQLKNLIERQKIFLTADKIFLQWNSKYDSSQYLTFDLDSIKKALRHSPYYFSQTSQNNCLSGIPTMCWIKNPDFKEAKVRFWSILTTLSFATSFLLLLVFFISQRQLNRENKLQRETAMQTLAHELRHPASSITLSLEFFRDRMGDLDENLQIELLRMIDEVRRLKLLVRASEQYLLTDSKKGIKLNVSRIQSLNSYLDRIAASYEVQYQPLKEDSSFSCDAYWLGVCIENLIKNALRHGKKPVVLTASKNGSRLTIEVIDQGQGLPLDFKEAINPFKKTQKSGGLGLGLSITHKMADMMGARLEYKTNPTRFKLSLEDKDIENAQNLAG